MRFDKEIVDGISLIKLQERKLDTSNSGLLKGELTDFVVQGKIIYLIMDLQEVESCDSSGLSVLLVAKKLIDDNDGFLCVIPSAKIKHLMEITKLDRALNLSDTLADALQKTKQTRRY